MMHLRLDFRCFFDVSSSVFFFPLFVVAKSFKKLDCLCFYKEEFFLFFLKQEQGNSLNTMMKSTNQIELIFMTIHIKSNLPSTSFFNPFCTHINLPTMLHLYLCGCLLRWKTLEWNSGKLEISWSSKLHSQNTVHVCRNHTHLQINVCRQTWKPWIHQKQPVSASGANRILGGNQDDVLVSPISASHFSLMRKRPGGFPPRTSSDPDHDHVFTQVTG